MCEERAAKAKRDAYASRGYECTAQARAACFTYYNQLIESSVAMCSSTTSQCEVSRKAVRSFKEEDDTKFSKCRAESPDFF